MRPLSSVSRSTLDALELGEQAVPAAKQSGERAWQGSERLNSTCGLAGLGKAAPAQDFLGSSILGGRWLINTRAPGTLARLFSKEGMVLSQKFPFPEQPISAQATRGQC